MSDSRIFNVYVKPIGRGNWREIPLALDVCGSLNVGNILECMGIKMRVTRITKGSPQTTTRIASP